MSAKTPRENHNIIEQADADITALSEALRAIGAARVKGAWTLKPWATDRMEQVLDAITDALDDAEREHADANRDLDLYRWENGPLLTVRTVSGPR